MEPNYYIPLILFWAVMTLFMAGMGLEIFDRPAKNRRLLAYMDPPKEWSDADKHDRKEGAWVFVLSPLAPLCLAVLIIVGIVCGLYYLGKFFLTTFPEMIRALR